MSKKLLEINDDDRGEIGRLVLQGNTNGILDDETSRISWSIDIEKWCRTCDGTGEVNADEKDRDGNTRVGVNVIPCPDCTTKPEPTEE